MTTFIHASPEKRPINPRDVLNRSAAAPDVTARYDIHADALMDLYWPNDEYRHAPLVVLFHGGYWRAKIDRTYLRPMAVALRDLGFVVAMPEYRRINTNAELKGGYPETFDDITKALNALPALLSAHGIKPVRTTLMGHSVGGHMVLWLSNTRAIPIDNVVALAPLVDLYAAHAQHLGEDAVCDFLGGSPTDVPDRYAATEVTPRFAIRPACDIGIIHGNDDDRVPIDNVRGLLKLYPWIELHELQGTGHFEVVDPLLHAWPIIHHLINHRN